MKYQRLFSGKIKHRGQFAWNAKAFFLRKLRKIFGNVCWNFYPGMLSTNSITNNGILVHNEKYKRLPSETRITQKNKNLRLIVHSNVICEDAYIP